MGMWGSAVRCHRGARPRATHLLAVLCAAMLGLQIGKPHYTNASVPQRAFGDPNLSIQFARGIEDIDAVLGDAPSPDREVLRIKLYLDFAFMASYVALFLALSLPLVRVRAWTQAAGIAAAVCGVGAGVFDVLENVAQFRILDVPLRHTTPAMINAIRSASAAKWWLAAATLALLGSYIRSPRRSARIWGAVSLGAAVLMAIGIVRLS
jgi:hypothetical protein